MAADFRIRLYLLSLCTLLLPLSEAFYVPGFSIKSYANGDSIPVFVNKVYSDNTQLQFAYSELPFVCPASGRKHGSTNLISGSSVSLNLGEILRGDRIIVSDYEMTFGNDDGIRFLCEKKIDRAAIARAKEIISGGYVAEWIVDNLPSATSFVTVDRSRKYYAAGFKLGYTADPTAPGEMPSYFLNNHVTLVIRYHTAPGKDGQRGRKVIVGFEVFPKSIGMSGRDSNGLPKDVHHIEEGLELTMHQNSTVRANSLSDSTLNLRQVDEDVHDGATLTVPYTYSVYFREEEDIEWQNRWDLFFVNQEDSSSIHWLAIVNSVVIAGLLAAVVAVILARTILGELKSYREPSLEDGRKRKIKPPKSPRRRSTEKTNNLLDPMGGSITQQDDSSDEEIVEDITGWKLVHADVFRTPSQGDWLAPLIGSGSQLVFMAVGLLLLSCFGILNPSFRGGFASVGVGLFVFAGLFSGYFSARIYKTFGGQLWKKNGIITASLLPGLLFAATFVLNLFVWAQASSTALPFTTLVGLIALWLLIQLPLVYIGSWVGFTYMGAYVHPIKASAIPRQIPRQAWWTSSVQSVLLAGLIPFAVIFIELLFIFKSTWMDKSGYYYVFGFLGVVAILTVITVAEVTLVAVYVMLCYENYHWWWHSFLVGSSSAFWIFVYCMYFYFVKLHIQGFLSGLLFFSYSFLACVVYGLLMGTVGFVTAYVFVRRIFGAIKVD